MNVKDIRRQNLRMLSREVGGVTKLANLLEKSQSQLSHLIGKKPIKNIGDKFAAHAERVFSKPHGWLDREHFGVQEANAPYHAGGPSFCRVPFLNWKIVSEWLADPSQLNLKAPLNYWVVNGAVGSRSFALQVEGDGMEAAHGPSFPQGTMIVVDPEHSASNGHFVLARQATQIVFKQLVVDGHRRYLKPLNPRYPVIEISAQTQICGVIRFMGMEFK